jgi:FkbM family methyltransferase
MTKDVWTNSFEIAMKYMGDRQGTALDIGCRDGQWTTHLCKRFDFTHGFDYRKMSSLFKVTDPKKFEFHKVALGESEYITKAKAGTIKPDHRSATSLVEVTTLDSFNIENVVFAKLDIEGYEPKALRGGEKTFRRDKPVLCVEINRDVETQKLLESWGYVFQQVDDIVGHDYFFVHKDFLG